MFCYLFQFYISGYFQLPAVSSSFHGSACLSRCCIICYSRISSLWGWDENRNATHNSSVAAYPSFSTNSISFSTRLSSFKCFLLRDRHAHTVKDRLRDWREVSFQLITGSYASVSDSWL